jgi:hypothetical protein
LTRRGSLATVLPMRLRPILATLLLALATLGMPGPSWAHLPLEPEAEVARGFGASADGRDGRGPGWALTAAPEATRLSWWTPAVVAMAAALAWRRPRRAAALALVLMLAVFAFEDGLHSVHHGLDQTQASSCSVAMAGSHLSATLVDGSAPDDVIPPVVALSAETSAPDAIARPANPEHGRAPPRPGSLV